ncbi:MAG: hypothetical protein ABF959_08965 [Gluconobacter albidus]|uniref:Uncharacterized protein n=1 Tax=Gluconobacter albidus TaxID=318683 RepID=A0AAW3QWV2_9PROT|nr:hypothetical protein [Gluconobacter albidus]KXV38229.1 hypothetical protein AD941_06810 [Gluconobacter albidus]GBQ93840.1 hypothetical protein AA3250_2930 [Gluconobacter albidus NBRC 3250]GLQ68930.1 hypothetical protein GCM10007866_13810 [Gluconobacter albidus]
MKRITFTGRCSGIGSVYNPGDIAVFPDSVADAIVAAKKGTAEAMPVKTLAKAESSSGAAGEGDGGDLLSGTDPSKESENGKS